MFFWDMNRGGKDARLGLFGADLGMLLGNLGGGEEPITQIAQLAGGVLHKTGGCTLPHTASKTYKYQRQGFRRTPPPLSPHHTQHTLNTHSTHTHTLMVAFFSASSPAPPPLSPTTPPTAVPTVCTASSAVPTARVIVCVVCVVCVLQKRAFEQRC